MGWAAMQWSFAQRGTGEVGPAVRRADGVVWPRERRRRGRDDGALVGTLPVARTCDRMAGEPGLFPLDAPVNRPARCDASVLQTWRTLCEVAPPGHERAGVFEPLVARELAARVLMAVAQEAPADEEGFAAPRPVLPGDTEAALLVVRCDGPGVPMITEVAGTRKAPVGAGEKRQLRGSVRETRAHVSTVFHNHRRWRPYDVDVAAGLPVGTGIVASACGAVVKHRMAGAGTRGRLKGAEAMLAWRSRKKSHDPDLRDSWRFRAHHVRTRRDRRQPP
jgi:hypothetical protein